MTEINGKEIAQKIIDELKALPVPNKKLVVVLADDNQASLSFVKAKQRVADELGVKFEINRSIEKVEEICDREDVGGVVVQLPLPSEFNRDKILAQLDPKKDVDNLTGKASVESPSVLVVKDILKEIKFDLRNKTVAVVGAQGFLIGRPVSQWLTASNIKHKEIDLETKNLQEALKDVDLIITGVGKKDLIDPKWLKEGAGVIDFGIPADLIQPSISSFQHLVFYTPVPGGTGPILVAELFKNFYKIC